MEVTDTEANFSGTELLGAGAVVLASFLPKITELTSLDISDNSIASKLAVTHLSKALKVNTTLSMLNVSQNGYALLLEALQSKTILWFNGRRRSQVAETWYTVLGNGCYLTPDEDGKLLNIRWSERRPSGALLAYYNPTKKGCNNPAHAKYKQGGKRKAYKVEKQLETWERFLSYARADQGEVIILDNTKVRVLRYECQDGNYGSCYALEAGESFKWFQNLSPTSDLKRMSICFGIIPVHWNDDLQRRTPAKFLDDVKNSKGISLNMEKKEVEDSKQVSDRAAALATAAQVALETTAQHSALRNSTALKAEHSAQAQTAVSPPPQQQEPAGGSSDSSACEDYRVDLAAGEFGMCICGFERAEHSAQAQTAAQSAPRQKWATIAAGAAMQQEPAGGSSDSGACEDYRVDLAAGEFGMCICGFERAEHSAQAQTAAQSAQRQKRAATGLGRGKY
jgi:hypothetical protein